MFGEFSHLEGTRHSAVVSHIYSTPENGTLAFACFSLSFCSGQKTAQKVILFWTPGGGAYILFSRCQLMQRSVRDGDAG